MSDENEKQPCKEPDAGESEPISNTVGSDDSRRTFVSGKGEVLPGLSTELIKTHIRRYQAALADLTEKKATFLDALQSTDELIAQANGAIAALGGILDDLTNTDMAEKE